MTETKKDLKLKIAGLKERLIGIENNRKRLVHFQTRAFEAERQLEEALGRIDSYKPAAKGRSEDAARIAFLEAENNKLKRELDAK